MIIFASLSRRRETVTTMASCPRDGGDVAVAIEYRPRRVLEAVAPEKKGILRRRAQEIVEVRDDHEAVLQKSIHPATRPVIRDDTARDSERSRTAAAGRRKGDDAKAGTHVGRIYISILRVYPGPSSTRSG
jgi:hypothetical protein